MGLHHGGAARQFVLQTAQGVAMVLGEHWFSPHSSSEPAHSQLQPREMPRSGPGISECETDHAALQFEFIHLPPLGRTASKAGRLPTPERFSRTTSSQLRWLEPSSRTLVAAPANQQTGDPVDRSHEMTEHESQTAFLRRCVLY